MPDTAMSRLLMAMKEWNDSLKVQNGVWLLTELTDEQRLAIMDHFCKACGSDNPRCTCMRDE